MYNFALKMKIEALNCWQGQQFDKVGETKEKYGVILFVRQNSMKYV